MIRNKTIKFDMNKQSDKVLWEFLQTLPHGMFSEDTKLYWLKEMSEGWEPPKKRGRKNED